MNQGEIVKPETQLKIIIPAKALISAVPWIGGSLNSVWNDLSLERYKKRLNDFLTKMNEEIKINNNNLDLEKINSEDFQDIFDNTLNLVIRNRHEKKREAFRKILINSMTENSIDFDKTEAFIKLIDQHPLMHLIILEDLRKIKVDDRDSKFGVKVFKEQVEKFGIDENSLYEIIMDLENNYLVHGYSSQYDMRDGGPGIVLTGMDNYLTFKGKELLELLN